MCRADEEGLAGPQSTMAGVGATDEAQPGGRDRENSLFPYTSCACIFFSLEGFLSVFLSVPFSCVPLASIWLCKWKVMRPVGPSVANSIAGICPKGSLSAQLI